MEESGIGRAETIMVGDSAVDVMTARNAQVRACGVSWGFQPETFAAAQPDFVIGSGRTGSAHGGGLVSRRQLAQILHYDRRCVSFGRLDRSQEPSLRASQ